uniref:hypothetical protein n=1 Tax=Cephaleuros parasiticus TaxID=173370 RepID=UPI001EDC9F4B|nr:hypothetical protein MFQ79_pgp099 [Cephaleuros parasiticus]UIB38963.1 hypothetical protein [Cephaleuros parasiticus]
MCADLSNNVRLHQGSSQLTSFSFFEVHFIRKMNPKKGKKRSLPQIFSAFRLKPKSNFHKRNSFTKNTTIKQLLLKKGCAGASPGIIKQIGNYLLQIKNSKSVFTTLIIRTDSLLQPLNIIPNQIFNMSFWGSGLAPDGEVFFPEVFFSMFFLQKNRLKCFSFRKTD